MAKINSGACIDLIYHLDHYLDVVQFAMRVVTASYQHQEILLLKGE